jgi:hypothetical protein
VGGAVKPGADLSEAAGIRGPQKKRSKAQQARDLRRSAQHNRVSYRAAGGRSWPRRVISEIRWNPEPAAER